MMLMMFLMEVKNFSISFCSFFSGFKGNVQGNLEKGQTKDLFLWFFSIILFPLTWVTRCFLPFPQLITWEALFMSLDTCAFSVTFQYTCRLMQRLTWKSCRYFLSFIWQFVMMKLQWKDIITMEIFMEKFGMKKEKRLSYVIKIDSMTLVMPSHFQSALKSMRETGEKGVDSDELHTECQAVCLVIKKTAYNTVPCMWLTFWVLSTKILLAWHVSCVLCLEHSLRVYAWETCVNKSISSHTLMSFVVVVVVVVSSCCAVIVCYILRGKKER